MNFPVLGGPPIPMARLAPMPASGTDGGYPWHDGELLYAADLNAAITASTASVLDLGAKGDGVTDDTIAIQTAMNTYAGKAILYIPDTGHPYIVSALSPPSGLSLWLDGTLKLVAAASASTSLIGFSGQSNITITGHGKLDGNGPAQTAVGISVMGGAATNLRVYGITITNGRWWNVNLTGCSNVRLDGINILGPGGAANEFAVGCDDCWLVNSLVDGTGLGDYSFCFYGGCTNCGAIGNTIRNAGAATAGFTPPGIGILSDGPAGTPTAMPCSNITIANNIIHDCAGPGISCLNNSGGQQAGITIVGNATHGNSKLNGGGIAGADVFIDLTTDVTIANNQFSANGGSIGSQFTGVFLGPHTSNISITGNRIYNVGAGSAAPATANAGVWVDGTIGLHMSGNYIYDDQPTPTTGYSIIGGCGAGSAIIGNFFERPYNFGPAADTVLANVMNGAWVVGGLTGTDSNLIVNGLPTNKVNLQYQSRGSARWYLGTDGTAETGGGAGANFRIASVADDGVTQTQQVFVDRFTGIFNFSQPASFGLVTRTTDCNVAITAAAGTNRYLNFATAGQARWFVGATSAPETGGGTGSDFNIISANDAGGQLKVLVINRATGQLQITTPPPFANDAAAAAGNVPVGGLYRIGSALQVRVI